MTESYRTYRAGLGAVLFGLYSSSFGFSLTDVSAKEMTCDRDVPVESSVTQITVNIRLVSTLSCQCWIFKP